jgi:hypothetical protein
MDMVLILRAKFAQNAWVTMSNNANLMHKMFRQISFAIKVMCLAWIKKTAISFAMITSTSRLTTTRSTRLNHQFIAQHAMKHVVAVTRKEQIDVYPAILESFLI